jgi:hypothetical protein
MRAPSAENTKETLMRRVLLFTLAGLWAGSVWPAFAGPQIPAAAIDQKDRLLGAKRVRYLLRQLDLTEAQAARAQELLETTLVDAGDAPVNIDEVRKLWTQIERAKDAGNQDKVDALTQRLQRLGQDTAADADFFMNLEPSLTGVQKEMLEQARARLDRNPSGAVRPIDLMRAARRLDLTEEQQDKMRAARAAARKKIGPLLKLSGKLERELVNLYADEVRALLTPEQLLQFEYRVRALRPDLVDAGLRVSVPTESAPAAPAAGEQTAPPDE